MNHDDIVEQNEEEERDRGFLEPKKMDIEGKTLELIADGTYNDYDEATETIIYYDEDGNVIYKQRIQTTN